MFLPLNSFENICVCFLLMIIYSTAGWIGEMIYHYIVLKHLSERRGFLTGLLCPIYGHGALLVLYVLNGGLKNPILTFLAGMVLTTALEYFNSWMMETIFHMRWWDYSHYKFQLTGRVLDLIRRGHAIHDDREFLADVSCGVGLRVLLSCLKRGPDLGGVDAERILPLDRQRVLHLGVAILGVNDCHLSFPPLNRA